MAIHYILSNKPLDDVIDVQPLHKGACHCQLIRFGVKLPNGLVNPRRCNCSMCKRRGAIVASVSLEDFSLLEGSDKLSCYQFGTHTAKHFFCSNCGIYTHHQRRSNPQEYAFNIACLEGIDPLVLRNVIVYDGAENHPSES